ncbi:MAG: hypothetical protein ACOC0P_05185 [Planctomycetota bacterium]
MRLPTPDLLLIALAGSVVTLWTVTVAGPISLGLMEVTENFQSAWKPVPGDSRAWSWPAAVRFFRYHAALEHGDQCRSCGARTDPEGNWLRTIGTSGTGPDEFAYPYGMLLESNRRVLITEFGNNRVQQLTRESKPIAQWGGHGREPGLLIGPWTSAALGDELLILDSRMVVFR